MTPVCETITLDNKKDENIAKITVKDGTKILTTTHYIKLEKMNCIVKIFIPEKFRDYSFMISIEPAKGYYQPWYTKKEEQPSILGMESGKTWLRRTKPVQG